MNLATMFLSTLNRLNLAHFPLLSSISRLLIRSHKALSQKTFGVFFGEHGYFM